MCAIFVFVCVWVCVCVIFVNGFLCKVFKVFVCLFVCVCVCDKADSFEHFVSKTQFHKLIFSYVILATGLDEWSQNFTMLYKAKLIFTIQNLIFTMLYKAKFCVFIFLESRDKSLNMFQVFSERSKIWKEEKEQMERPWCEIRSQFTEHLVWTRKSIS